MKRILFIVIPLLCCALFTSCSQAFLNSIPSGYIGAEEHMDPEGFQDYVDYCKYFFDSTKKFENNKKYKMVSAEDVEEICGYFNNFASWMESENRLDEYDFDVSCITVGDYVRIESEILFDYKYSDYTLWFFDTETLTLYYIHANI